LYRVRDTDGDDQYDSVEMLRQFDGEGEHGPHAVILSPDRNSLYVCAGNHTPIPKPERSRVPRVWQEDQVVPRLPDAGGHAVGIMAPGGWICRTDPDGREFELISIGFRNQYDIAFNSEGELFTYDADMEWDIGLPWYRPTRVCHVTSGSEFGWRNGSGKWPAYYPDNLPAVVDVGPGSPTGITFGNGANFPIEYQRSLFIADWSYGIIYRIQLGRSGASYRGEIETFCTAPVLPVTDLITNPVDGAMYFLTGGRRAESALYRIRYAGDSTRSRVLLPESLPQGEPLPDGGSEANSQSLFETRQRLEKLHSEPKIENVDLAWPYLSHPDRFIRFAARTAIELVPDRSWHVRAFAENETQASLEALLAVVRTSGSNAGHEKIVERLVSMDFQNLTHSQQLHLLRNLGLVLARIQPISESALAAMRSLSRFLPSDSDELNRELVRLLAAAEAPEAVEKALALMTEAETQQQQIHYAISLHAVKSGWTPALKKRYLEWFAASARYAGGSSFRQYLLNIRNEFSQRLSADEQDSLKALLSLPLDSQDPYGELEARAIVRNWSMSDLANLPLEQADIKNGERMFAVAQCFKCHLVQGRGGIVGPDLTNAGRRFSTRDLLETIIDPDKAVSDQYRATVFELEDGRLISGRIVNLVRDEYLIQEDMIKPGELTRVRANEIESMQPAKKSMMPSGLLDTLKETEIADLLGFMKSIHPN
jgi:hypothetical protein